MENTSFAMPRLGEPAPAFDASTTEGPISFPADFKGRWVILFSHPADFTPVCTSEFMTFGSLQADFERLNCQLIGLSVDGLASHIAWLRRIEEKVEWKGMKGLKIRFPLIDDVSMKIANAYGMIQPHQSETAAVRAVFFIDPVGVVRTILYYPLSLGRNFDEIKRILIGLQTNDNFKVSLPADWRPGDEVIVPAPKTMEAAAARDTEKGINIHDWFFATRPLSKEEVEAKLYPKK
jgi:peroxiredoxin (alkyl hydroperoxide reductase subunit C)